MQSRAIELLVGLFVCLGIAAIFILTVQVSDLGQARRVSGYHVTASFDNIGKLKVGAPVELAGVTIGRVTAIHLDQDTYQAVATLRIKQKYKIPRDSDASILTAGLLGDQYIGVGPGGDERNMHDGDDFIITQSAVILEKLIGQFMTHLAGKDDSNGKDDSHHDTGGTDTSAATSP